MIHVFIKQTSNEYTQTIHRGRSSLDLSPNSHNLLTRGESSKKIMGVQGLLVLNPFTYLLDIVLILFGEILSWSLMGVKVLR